MSFGPPVTPFSITSDAAAIVIRPTPEAINSISAPIYKAGVASAGTVSCLALAFVKRKGAPLSASISISTKK